MLGLKTLLGCDMGIFQQAVATLIAEYPDMTIGVVERVLLVRGDCKSKEIPKILKVIKPATDENLAVIASSDLGPGKYRVLRTLPVSIGEATVTEKVTELEKGDEIEIVETGIYKGAPRGRYLQGWVSFRALPTKDAKDSTPSLKLIHPNQTAYSTLLENFPQLRKVPKL